MNLAEARWFARRRQQEHNHERPHSSLGYQTPAQFAAARASPLPLRLRLSLRSSSTREPKTSQPLPNPYSHNTWHKNWGIPGELQTRLSAVASRGF